MIIKQIPFVNFNDEQVIETAMFHLSAPELVRLEAKYEGGLSAHLDRVSETEDNSEIVKLFEHLISMAYGFKSEDGNRFVKSDKMTEVFKQSLAYDELFMSLLKDEEEASNFLIALLPSNIKKQVLADQNKQK